MLQPPLFWEELIKPPNEWPLFAFSLLVWVFFPPSFLLWNRLDLETAVEKKLKRPECARSLVVGG